MKIIYITKEELTFVKSVLTGDYEVLVFGSRLTGKHSPFSDLDLCLKAGAAIALKELAVIRAQFDESDLPYRVDIVDFNDLSDSFREHILNNSASLTDVTEAKA